MAVPSMTNNSPASGYIAWGAFTIQLYGVAYSVSAGSTNQKWVWWEYNAGAPVINAGASVPASLTADDLVLFANKLGIGVRVQSASFVDGELLVDGSIFTNALSTNLINSDHIVAAGLNASVIKFGTMSGDRISANTITAEKLTVGSLGSDLVLNGGFEDDTYWVKGTTASRVAVAARSGGWGMRLTNAAAAGISSPQFPCAAGDILAVVGWAKGVTATTGLYFRISWRNSAGAEISASDTLANSAVTVGTWTQNGATAAAPANSVGAIFTVYNTSGTVDIDDLSVSPVIVSAQIGDGQILALKIKAGELNSNHITTTGLDAAVIKFGEMSGDRISANYIYANAISAGQIVSGKVTASLVIGSQIEAHGLDSTNAWTGAVVGMSSVDGFYSYGATPAGKTLAERDLYISFPINGKPNIISGQLTASTMLVTGGATLRGSSAIEASGKLVLNGDIKAPKNAPSLGPSYEYVTLAKPSGTSNWAGLCRVANSSIYAGVYAGTGTGSKICKFTTAGALSATYNPAWFTQAATGYTRAIIGLTYNASKGVFYVLGQENRTSTSKFFYILTYDSTFTLIGTPINVPTNTPNEPALCLGYDYVQNKPLTFQIESTALTGIVKTWDVNVDGSPNGVVLSTTTLAGTGSGYYLQPVAIMRGTFDMGADRYVLKYSTSEDPWKIHTSTGVHQTSESWPAASNLWHDGGWWDSTLGKFFGLSSAGVAITYEGGDSYWTSGASKWWAGYTWYDSAGTAHETTSSPYGTLTMIKRAKLSATVDPVPGALGAEDPNSVNIYVGKLDGTVAPATTAMFKRAALASTVQTAVISGVANGTALSAKAIAFDPAVVPGAIESNDGGSYWRGDNTAKFLQLHLDSTSDVTNTAGNKPALRIGNIAGAHLRVDSNEIIAMASDTVQTTLYLNAGGYTTLGSNTVKAGTKTCTYATANVQAGPFAVVFGSAFPTSTPIPVVMLTPNGTTANAYVSVRNITRSGFDIYIRRLTAVDLDVDWVAWSP